MSGKQLHVALLSSPGMGHLIPVLSLGHRLHSHHNLRVTILSVTTNTESQLPTHFQLPIIAIPAADISGLVAPDAKIVTQLCVMMRETIPNIRSTISSMNPRPDVLIADIFSMESWIVAEEFGIRKYVFVPSTAWFTALVTYSPVLDKEVVGQYVDQTQPLQIPGCKPVRPEDVVDPMLDRDDEVYKVHLQQSVKYPLADGMLLNTWEDLEPQTLYALRNNEIFRPVIKSKPVYTIGPLHKQYEPAGSKCEVIEWLDKQPTNSVIYVSFGSGGTLSADQMSELAWGLELSRQRFVWVVRPPTSYGADTDASYINGSSRPCQHDYFPKGFLTRTQKVGLVVPLWGPQVQILNHNSVGGFMTHCGWNSTLESIMSGVPMIAWPLYAEQRMNATMLTEELRVAIRPKVLPTKKVVRREEVEKMVRVLMEGEEGEAMRIRVKELRGNGEEALKIDGSSYISMCEFIQECLSQVE